MNIKGAKNKDFISKQLTDFVIPSQGYLLNA